MTFGTYQHSSFSYLNLVGLGNVRYNPSMTKTIEAIYSHGVLEPLQALDLPEKQRVRLTVEAINGTPASDREAAFAEFLKGVRSMNFHLDGPLPTRDELHER